MIKLQSVNKYYNKRKNNEIHVLKDISLTLQEHGMVVLLGPSGSGKTTLLNVMGGLDSIHSGTIECLDKTFTRYQANHWDTLRAIEIGVIFQNYNLIMQETVFENIAITLRMLGYKDEALIENRVMSLLQAVKMERFYKRRAVQLSGGQQQRVAIARSLAKKPRLLITDEPTGNLDSKNTYDVMRILRKVADQTLVIMVTHEEALARQFADRILRLEDGRIMSDESNTPSSQIHQHFDGDIYLGDFANHYSVDSKDAPVQFYSDAPVKDPMDVTFVLEQNTLYFKVNHPDVQKIIQVDAESDIRFKPGKRAGATVDESDDYDLSAIETFEKKASIKNVLDFKDTIRMTLKSIAQSTRGMKFLYAGFILTGALIAISLGFLNRIITVPEETVKEYPASTLVVEKAALTGSDDLAQIAADYSSGESGTLRTFIRLETGYDLVMYPIYQTQRETFSYGAFFDAELLQSDDLLYGRLPSNPFEIVIDRLHAETLLNNDTLVAYEIVSPTMLIGLTISFGNQEFTITGLSDGVADGLFVNTQSYPLIRSNQLQGATHFDTVLETISLNTERLPSTGQDVLVNESIYSDGVPLSIEINGLSFTVIGTYVSDSEFSPLVGSEGVDRLLYERLNPDEKIGFYATDSNALKTVLNTRAIPFEDALEEAIRETRETNVEDSIGLLVLTIIGLTASGLSFYFIIRSSLIQRVKEIGVYRSLGIRSRDILKLFAIEALILSTLTSILGFLGMNFVLNQIQQSTRDIIEIISVTGLSIAAGIAFIYVINLVSGLLPVFNLLRKTPSAILAKYDI